MRNISICSACLAAILLATGCASAPPHSDFSKSLPAVGPEQGRIIIYRPWKFTIVGINPPVILNGERIGGSIFGEFYYVDRPPGQYEIGMNDIYYKKKLALLLEKGQTCYVRLDTSNVSIPVGEVIPTLVEPAVGEKEIQDCKYNSENSPKP